MYHDIIVAALTKMSTLLKYVQIGWKLHDDFNIVLKLAKEEITIRYEYSAR